MKCLLCLLLLAGAAYAAEPTPPDAAAVLALTIAQRQAPATPQAPPAVRQYCDCISSGSQNADCTCDPAQCGCQFGRPCPYVAAPPPVLLHKAAPIAEPVYQLLILSRRDCPPCARTAADLRANGQADAFPKWDVFTDRADLNAKYGATAFPTIILLKGGQEVSRRDGYMSAADLLRWVHDPDGPQSRGESVPATTYAVTRPTYQAMPMRWASPAACGT